MKFTIPYGNSWLRGGGQTFKPYGYGMCFPLPYGNIRAGRQKDPRTVNAPSPIMNIRAEDYEALRRHLLREDGLERVSYLFFGIRDNQPIENFFIHRVINLDDGDYDRQTATYVLPRMDILLKIFRKFENSVVPGFMHVHSHPFCEHAVFSHTDNLSAGNAVRSVGDYLAAGGIKTGYVFGRMVIGRNEAGFSAELRDEKFASKGEVQKLKVVGPTGIRKIGGDLSSPDVSDQIGDRELLDRNIRWLGEDGQRLLSGSHLAICGVGGAGSLVALNARGLGLRKITLIDHDRIERSNLNRLPAASLKDIGAYKVEVMRKMIEDVSPQTEVEPIIERIPGEVTTRAIAAADIVISAVDSFAIRFDIQVLAARYLKPLIDIGAGIILDAENNCVKTMGGQVAAYLPSGPCLCCQGVIPREIDSTLDVEVKKATGYVRGSKMTPTAVSTINSVMAGHAVDMLIKYLTGFAEIPRYIQCDMLKNRYEIFRFGRRQDCLICGKEGIEGSGAEIEQIMLPSKGWEQETV